MSHTASGVQAKLCFPPITPHPYIMALREFTDAAGRRWNAWDVYPSYTQLDLASRRTSGGYDPPAWLAFECPATGERRRLSPVPDDWSARPDAEIVALCECAQVTPRPDRPAR